MKKFDINKTVAKINTDLASKGWPLLRVLEITPEDPYTYCRVLVGGCLGSGFAKRNPMDRPSRHQGIRLALRRAVCKAVNAYKSQMIKPGEVAAASC